MLALLWLKESERLGVPEVWGDRFVTRAQRPLATTLYYAKSDMANFLRGSSSPRASGSGSASPRASNTSGPGSGSSSPRAP